MEKIIKSVANLSIEELDRLENEEKINRIIISKRPNIPEDVPTKLSVKEYRRIYNALTCITSGIKEEWSPTKKFVLIYKRLAESIFYDYIAAYPKDEEQEKYSDREFENCRNLKNGLLLRRCVCTGYAEILRNACLLKGVNAIVIHGLTSDGELHAWNQVEIDDGKWIEVDLTWDSSNRTLTKYMGKDKNKFWEKHRRINYSVSKIIFCEENMVSNFDLTAFINEQFGLNCRYFSIEEQDEFIRILDRRDTQSLDISKTLNSLIFKINQRIDFEKECGYTIDELIEIGFLKKEIDQLVKNRFDEKTGRIIDRKKIVENQINRLLKKQEDFEEECGYTIDELVRMGFEKEEIELLKRNKFDGETGKRLDRKRIIEEAVNVVLKKQEGVKRSYRYLIDKVTPIKMITEEENSLLTFKV